MSTPVIQVKNVGKKYLLGEDHASASNLREAIIGSLQFWRRKPPTKRKELWANRHLSFDIQQGETVGFIGRNGAGKSTLLKLLSRISLPTEGSIRISGRVGALLEVGTGFHPELTGMENIYLSGAILGMTRDEITSKLKDIIAFSGISKFLDTPVKRYSSGMRVRLGFSVAAHLDPEILIVDEVLSVGDSEFRAKCVSKMRDIARTENRTVLFVSHNTEAVQSLCSRVIYLENGRVKFDGDVSDGLTRYAEDIEAAATLPLHQRTEREGLGAVQLHSIWLEDDSGQTLTNFACGQTVRIRFRLTKPMSHWRLDYSITDQIGTPIVATTSMRSAPSDSPRPSHLLEATCTIPNLPLRPGRYLINVALIEDGKVQDRIQGATAFDIEAGLLCGRMVGPELAHTSITFPYHWTWEAADELGDKSRLAELDGVEHN